jgi:hypothetical protein
MGEKPDGRTLDRIDNDKNYSPENCRWATVFEQAQHRKGSKLFTFRGHTLSTSVWARVIGITRVSMARRFRTLSVEEALTRDIVGSHRPPGKAGEISAKRIKELAAPANKTYNRIL